MLHVIWSSTLSPRPSWSSSGYSGRQAGPCRSARSTSELAAPIVTSGVKQAYQTWGWAASIGKSLRRSGSSPRGRSNRRGAPGGPGGHLSLSGQGGKTTVTQTVLYQSQEARDAVLKSGMEKGVAASYDRLGVLLAKLPAQGMEKGAGGS